MQRSSATVLAGLLAIGAAGVAWLWLQGGHGDGPRAALSPSGATDVSRAVDAPDPAPPRSPVHVEPVHVQETEPHGREVVELGRANDANAVLQGTVVASAGGVEIPAAGVTALLVPGQEEPSAQRVAELLAQPLPAHLQVTDEQGHFTFVGLEVGAPYALLLGGQGRIGAQRFWPVQPDASVRVFRMHELYGAILRLRDEHGARPHVHRGLVGQRAGKALSTRPGVFPLFGTASAALLAGVTLEQLDPEVVADRLLLFTSQEVEEQVGPFQFRANFPGYEPVDVPFEARRASQGFSVYEVRVVATAEGFGELEIEALGWRGPCPAFAPDLGARAYLRLNSASGEVIHFEVRDVSADPLRIAGIPWGEYEATFGTSPHLRSTVRGGGEAQRIRIGPVPARMRIDLAHRGSLVLSLSNADGVLHAGRVALLLSTGDRTTRGWRTHHFNAPPYRIDDLEPGTWNLYLQIPYSAGTSAELPLPVSVAGGTCTQVELSEQR